ncbi:MAG: hypothetical protein ACI4PG_11475 [Candidatus Ventricola sp.]
MKAIKTLLACALLCVALAPAAAEDAVAALAPVPMPAEADAQVLALYCGPTQGFYRHGGQTLCTGAPYVVFGQYDCWAMAAQGTAEDFGPVGWVEAGSLSDLEGAAELGFDDGFAAMVEQDAPVTDDPLADDPYAAWDAVLPRGTQVIVLAQLNGWLYVQAELNGVPARVFIPAETIE